MNGEATRAEIVQADNRGESLIAYPEHTVIGYVTEEQIAIALERWPFKHYWPIRHLQPRLSYDRLQPALGRRNRDWPARLSVIS